MDEYEKKLVIMRLMKSPPGISLHIGKFGSFTPAQLIKEIENNTPIGRSTVESQIRTMVRTARINKWLQDE